RGSSALPYRRCRTSVLPEIDASRPDTTVPAHATRVAALACARAIRSAWALSHVNETNERHAKGENRSSPEREECRRLLSAIGPTFPQPMHRQPRPEWRQHQADSRQKRMRNQASPHDEQAQDAGANTHYKISGCGQNRCDDTVRPLRRLEPLPPEARHELKGNLGEDLEDKLQQKPD